MAEKPWQRRPDLGEGRKAYHAFSHYRDLEPRQRSLDRAYTVCRVQCHGLVVSGTEPGSVPSPLREASAKWKEWKKRYQWDARADAHDAEVEVEQQLKRQKAIDEMNERHAAIATHMQAKVIERIQTLDGKTLSVSQVVNLFEKSARAERIARGEPTEIVRQQTTPEEDFSVMSDEDLERLMKLEDEREAILAKAKRAGKTDGDRSA